LGLEHVQPREVGLRFVVPMPFFIRRGGGGLWSMLIIYAQFFCWGVVRLDGVVMW